MICGICGTVVQNFHEFRVRIWMSHISYRSSGYGYECPTELTEVLCRGKYIPGYGSVRTLPTTTLEFWVRVTYLRFPSKLGVCWQFEFRRIEKKRFQKDLSAENAKKTQRTARAKSAHNMYTICVRPLWLADQEDMLNSGYFVAVHEIWADELKSCSWLAQLVFRLPSRGSLAPWHVILALRRVHPSWGLNKIHAL